MKTRRDFIKLFGGLAAAGTTLFAGGKVLAKPEPEELDKDCDLAERVLDHKRRMERIQKAQSNAPKENAHGILRLAQAASQWVHEDKVQRGHWFTHNYGSTDCIDLGPEIIADMIDYVGMKAMSFDAGELGTLPTGVTTDPESPEFKEIVKRSQMPYPAPIGQMWGPVFMITGRHPDSGRKIHAEFFCHSKTLRKFASDYLMRARRWNGDTVVDAFNKYKSGVPVQYKTTLISKLVSNSRFSYYLPELRFRDDILETR